MSLRNGISLGTRKQILEGFFAVLNCCTGLKDVTSVAHTVIPSPRSTAATHELTHKGDINYKTITEKEREILDFNVTLLTGAITRCRHLVVDMHRT